MRRALGLALLLPLLVGLKCRDDEALSAAEQVEDSSALTLRSAVPVVGPEPEAEHPPDAAVMEPPCAPPARVVVALWNALVDPARRWPLERCLPR
jgi:hypothetical protein